MVADSNLSPVARDATYFDQWYADMTVSTVRDGILQRNLGLPEELGGAGVLAWDGVQEVADSLCLSPGDLLLDVACGRGIYGIEVARRCAAHLVGVDFSPVALDQAREIAARRLAHGQAEFRVGTLTATAQADGTADAIMCTDSVQFAEPALDALVEFRRVLRAGGRLVLTTWQASIPNDQRLAPRLRELDLERDLARAGFRAINLGCRPDWHAAERRALEEAVRTPNPGHDAALASLQEEGARSLAGFDRLQRVIASAIAA